MSKQQKWIKALKDLPAWVSGAIGLATALVSFVVLIQKNYYLGITILGLLIFTSTACLCIYLTFAKTPPLVAGGKGVYRFESYRPWSLLGMGLIIVIMGVAFAYSPSRSFIVTAFIGTATPTSTPSPTPTPTRTLTPRPTPTSTSIPTLPPAAILAGTDTPPNYVRVTFAIASDSPAGSYFVIESSTGNTVIEFQIYPGDEQTFYLPSGEYSYYARTPLPTRPSMCYELVSSYPFIQYEDFSVFQDEIEIKLRFGTEYIRIPDCTPSSRNP